MDPSRWIRSRCAPALTHIILLRRAVEAGGVDPHALRARIEGAIVNSIQWDEDARTAGFTAAHVQRVRLALIASADEITQRRDSRCDYSAPPPPNEPSLLQQKYFKAWKAGHTFFEELDVTLKEPRPSEVERAILELFALCLALGIRGKYEAHDISGYEAMRARVADKLRLEPIVGPPLAAAVPWPHPAPIRRWPLWIGLSALIFSGAMLLTYRLELGRHASGLRDFLQQILDRTLT